MAGGDNGGWVGGGGVTRHCKRKKRGNDYGRLRGPRADGQKQTTAHTAHTTRHLSVCSQAKDATRGVRTFSSARARTRLRPAASLRASSAPLSLFSPLSLRVGVKRRRQLLLELRDLGVAGRRRLDRREHERRARGVVLGRLERRLRDDRDLVAALLLGEER